MKTPILSITAFAAMFAIAGAALATEGTQTPATGAKVSKEERTDARTKRRADMAAAQKKGELAQSEQDKATARKPLSAADRAARAEKRAEISKDNKAGKMPSSNEAETQKK